MDKRIVAHNPAEGETPARQSPDADALPLSGESAARAGEEPLAAADEMEKRLQEIEEKTRQASLLESENTRLQRIIDSVPSGIGFFRIEKDAPETITLNRYFLERVDLPGVVGNKALLDRLPACLHPDDRERCRQDIARIREEKQHVTAMYRFRRAGGAQYYWGKIRTKLARLSDGSEVCYVVFTNEDELKTAEADLRESRRFYREAVQAAKLITWEYDIPNRTVIMSDDPVSKNDYNQLGLPGVMRDVPDSLIDYIRQEDQAEFLRMYRDVEQGKSASCEVWYKALNGREPRCRRLTYILIDNADGGVTRAIGLGQDITAERKAEERYQRELGYLRQNGASDLIAKGRYNLTKNTALEYTEKVDGVFQPRPRRTYEEAYASFVDMAYQPEERALVAESFSRENLIRRYQRGETQTSLQYRRCGEGQLPFWVAMNIHTYFMPETGDLECFAYAYDITEKKRTDEIMSLISDEEFDYIGLLYVRTGTFEFIKKSPAIAFPALRERVDYGVCCDYVRRNFVNESERARFDAAMSLEKIAAVLREKNRYTPTYRRTEGDRVFCKQIDYFWLDRDAEIVLAVRSDVTAAYERDLEQMALVQAAKLEADRANEAKSAFLSSMSHDLRTPLNGVIGFTELALRESDPEKMRDYLRKIDSAGKLLLDLVNDTLELSRIESGKTTLSPEAVMPDDLIPAVVMALRPSAELKGVTLKTDFPTGRTKPVWCDRLKMQKIALNLISNAIKYTPEGGTVSVRLLRLDSGVPDCRYSLVVEDNGIGMSEEFMRRMYEPFSQEKRSESVKVSGTGLGLSIVKEYVDLMGGKISATSRLHGGTRFVVSLPDPEVSAGLEDCRRMETDSAALAGKRVLLCEDNYMNTEIAVMLLKDRGVRTDTAENGREGVEKFAASAVGYYDAILMDIRMPVMDGCEAARQIRALSRADAAGVPIIAMTADAFEESVREAVEAGMNDYVTKPVDPEKLCAALAAAVERRGR